MNELIFFVLGIAFISVMITVTHILMNIHEDNIDRAKEIESIAAAKREAEWQLKRDEFKARNKPAFKSTAPTAKAAAEKTRKESGEF